MTDRGELAESLVARMRSRPAAYPDVTTVTREAGAGKGELDALFHEHYHAPAAVLLRRIRVEAGFGHDADFLAVHAMPRAARGRVRSAVKALLLDGTPAVLQLELQDLHAVCRVDRAVSREGMRAAHAAAVRMLGLNADPAPFERRAARDTGVRRLIAGRRGLRVPLTSTLFEALVWTIAGQQVNLSFAYRLRRVVLELAGKGVDGFVAHPDAAAVARLDYDDLTRRQWSRRKAEYVIDVARSVA